MQEEGKPFPARSGCMTYMPRSSQPRRQQSAPDIAPIPRSGQATAREPRGRWLQRTCQNLTFNSPSPKLGKRSRSAQRSQPTACCAKLPWIVLVSTALVSTPVSMVNSGWLPRCLHEKRLFSGCCNHGGHGTQRCGTQLGTQLGTHGKRGVSYSKKL